jgi:fumarate reductase flavoprotein subunit
MSETEKGSVLVVGAGMGGLVAAVRAQELGADVTLIEKGSQVGGTMVMSGGGIWCAKTYEGIRELVPRGNPDLCRALVENFTDSVEWLESIEAPVTNIPVPAYNKVERWVVEMSPGTSQFAAHMRDLFLSRGGSLHLDTSALKLIIGERGEVQGVSARTLDGLATFRADATILATGGFQGSSEMLTRYFGRWADRFIRRANPRSVGDGLMLGTDAGASTSGSMASFYGHLLPAPPAVVPPEDFVAVTQYFSTHAVLVNQQGERFTDESEGDEMNAQATALQSEALAYMIYDHDVYSQNAIVKGVGDRVSDKFYESKAMGAPAATADTLEELATIMEGWGVYAPGVLETVWQYNEAVDAGRAQHLRIPKRNHAEPILKPPLYALGVTPGVTFTLGGLKINTNAQVIDRRDIPMPGLYAVGADGGGIFNEKYGGGLCLGLVFGRLAAQHATR